jgi:hypothetical protein
VDERDLQHDDNDRHGVEAPDTLSTEETRTAGGSAYAAQIHPRNQGQDGRGCVMKKHR